MEKENFRVQKYPKFQVHWTVKLLGWVWAAALVFIIGMVIGGMLGFIETPDEDGVKDDVTALDVPSLDQRGEFPTGCESVTAVMALNYAGVDISVEGFVDRYLSMGSAPHVVEGEWISADPNTAFMGDPRSEDGWGCYAPVIESAVWQVLKDKEPERTVVNLCGMKLSELVEEYINEGVPVMVWATQGMEQPSYGETLTAEDTGRRFDWIRPEHCLLLVGERGDTYLFNDPLEGKTVAYSKKATQTAFEAMGSQALAIK